MKSSLCCCGAGSVGGGGVGMFIRSSFATVSVEEDCVCSAEDFVSLLLVGSRSLTRKARGGKDGGGK